VEVASVVEEYEDVRLVVEALVTVRSAVELEKVNDGEAPNEPPLLN